MSEARAPTHTMTNFVVSAFVSIREDACERAVLYEELDNSYAATGQALEYISVATLKRVA